MQKKWFRIWRLEEVCSEDSDTEQDISSEESEDELEMNEECIFGKNKASNGGKIQ